MGEIVLKRYFPPLKDLFIKAIQITIQEDKKRLNESIFLLQLENETFNDRVIANFLILASEYYSREDILNWWREEFFKNPKSREI